MVCYPFEDKNFDPIFHISPFISHSLVITLYYRMLIVIFESQSALYGYVPGERYSDGPKGEDGRRVEDMGGGGIKKIE